MLQEMLCYIRWTSLIAFNIFYEGITFFCIQGLTMLVPQVIFQIEAQKDLDWSPPRECNLQSTELQISIHTKINCHNGTSSPDKVLTVLQTKRQVEVKAQCLVACPEVADEVWWLSGETDQTLRLCKTKQIKKSLQVNGEKRGKMLRRENKCIFPNIVYKHI